MITVNGTSHLTVKEFAARVGVSFVTVRKYVRQGRVACIQFSGRTSPLLIPEGEVEAFLRRSYRPATTAPQVA